MEQSTSFLAFQPYHSISNTNNKKTLSIFTSEIPPDTQWIAIEKIHGCNFSATTNGNVVQWASRSSYINGSGLQQFHHANLIQQKYDTHMNQLFHILKNRDNSIHYITVFGELYGGKYPGLSSTNKCKPVQKEIAYLPDIDFIVYDINWSNSTSKSNYFNYNDVLSLCQSIQLPVLDILATGTLTELLQLNPIFPTTIPQIHQLPIIENNYAEGYILKPMVNIELFEHRAILKHKNPTFHENVSTTIHPIKEPKNIGDIIHQTVLDQMKQYININRINAVASKYQTDIHPKLLAKNVATDALTDIINEIDQDNVIRNNQKVVLKYLIFYTEEFMLKMN